MPTVLVTGSNRGLGLEFVRQYAADGWHVLACARAPDRAEALHEIAASAGGRVEVHALDVTDHAVVDALAARLAGRPIDVLLNSAGTMGRRNFAKEGLAMDRFGESDFDDWAGIFRVNMMGPMKMAGAFAPHVAASAEKKIVALTSVIGSIASNTIGGLYSYRASKAGLNAIMRSMAIDAGKRYGIIAAPIHPGWVRTELGGPRADLDAPTSVAGVRNVIAGLTKEKAGRFWMYDGTELPW